jgi:hypothetical protein
MTWVDRINSRGEQFKQWLPSQPGDREPEWGYGHPHNTWCPTCGAKWQLVFPKEYQNEDGTPNARGIEVLTVAREAMVKMAPKHLKERDPWEGATNVWVLDIYHDEKTHAEYRPNYLAEEREADAPLERPRRPHDDNDLGF